MHQLRPGSRPSYFINELLWINLSVTQDVAGAINQKMILTNIVQDAILYLRMKYQHVLKKFPNPNTHLHNSIIHSM